MWVCDCAFAASAWVSAEFFFFIFFCCVAHRLGIIQIPFVSLRQFDFFYLVCCLQVAALSPNDNPHGTSFVPFSATNINSTAVEKNERNIYLMECTDKKNTKAKWYVLLCECVCFHTACHIIRIWWIYLSHIMCALNEKKDSDSEEKISCQNTKANP